MSSNFWDRTKSGEGSCILWAAYCKPNGYGYLRRNGKALYAHRVSYEMTYGEIPVGMWVLHSCDNPPCVNPEHLFLGTPKDNTRDMVAKGRRSPICNASLNQGRGELNPAAKYSDQTRELICIMRFDQHLKYREIADTLSIHRGTIGYIVRASDRYAEGLV